MQIRTEAISHKTVTALLMTTIDPETSNDEKLTAFARSRLQLQRSENVWDEYDRNLAAARKVSAKQMESGRFLSIYWNVVFVVLGTLQTGYGDYLVQWIGF